MADHVSVINRSRIMRSVPTKNTSTEMAVRSLLTRLGWRYRLHRKDLPGTPDIVFPGKKKVIFVNGCFWHGHKECPKARLPRSRPEYWTPKIARNTQKDFGYRFGYRRQFALISASYAKLQVGMGLACSPIPLNFACLS
jgi:DNA mismatch endonuclease, patch repair protein